MGQQQLLQRNGTGISEFGQLQPIPSEEPFSKQPEYMWLDGELVSFQEATVHLLNPTLHYGSGVFEGIRCYATRRGPAIFRLRQHLERFLNSVRILGVREFQYDVEQLRDVICRVVQVNNLNECYIRPLLYFEGPLALSLDAYRPVLAVAAWPWDPLLGLEAGRKGISVMVSSFDRTQSSAGLRKGKISGQYLGPILAKTMAMRAGFDEAIMLDAEGYVSGCTSENLLLVQDGTVLTSAGPTIMDGITRDTVLTLVNDLQLPLVEERISRDQLYIADEAFVCSTAAEIVPINEIDHRPVNTRRPGSLTRRLQQLFSDSVRGEGQHSAEWLDYVVMEPLI